MTLIWRILAVVFWILTLITLGKDLLALQREGTFEPTALGTWWFEVHRTSLESAQVIVERYLSFIPNLWDPIIVTMLLWPAWAVLGVLAILFTVWSWRRGRRRIFGPR